MPWQPESSNKTIKTSNRNYWGEKNLLQTGMSSAGDSWSGGAECEELQATCTMQPWTAAPLFQRGTLRPSPQYLGVLLSLLGPGQAGVAADLQPESWCCTSTSWPKAQLHGRQTGFLHKGVFRAGTIPSPFMVKRQSKGILWTCRLHMGHALAPQRDEYYFLQLLQCVTQPFWRMPFLLLIASLL